MLQEKFNKNKSQEIILLYVGRLISRKNVDKIIYAFEKLYKKYKLKLFIVGDGPDRKRLENISSHAMFAGVVPDTEKYYKQADIFISPSLSILIILHIMHLTICLLYLFLSVHIILQCIL